MKRVERQSSEGGRGRVGIIIGSGCTPYEPGASTESSNGKHTLFRVAQDQLILMSWSGRL